MPMFHMEHCVFCHTLSTGTDATNCGRPCDVHRVRLRDRVGAEFPLLADTGCRNTVFNSVAQSAAEYLPRMMQLGLRHFRVELLLEQGDEVGKTLDRYARVLAGVDDGRQAWRGLQVLSQLGVTRGTLRE
jgi:putative protease